MQIYPYLLFNGETAQAMGFYQEVLGGTLDINRFSEMPDFEQHFTEDMADRVMNAQLRCDGAVLMASDGCPDQPVGKRDGCSIAIEISDPVRAANVFEALAKDGEVLMAWAPTFWAAGFGMVKDKYDVSWMINNEIKK